MNQTPHEGGAQNGHGNGRGTTKNIGEEKGNPRSSPEKVQLRPTSPPPRLGCGAEEVAEAGGGSQAYQAREATARRQPSSITAAALTCISSSGFIEMCYPRHIINPVCLRNTNCKIGSRIITYGITIRNIQII
jgi:hypothetical protein